MGAHQNPVQRAVVLGVAVVGAGLDGTFDALVCVVFHFIFLLLIGYNASMPRIPHLNPRKNLPIRCFFVFGMI